MKSSRVGDDGAAGRLLQCDDLAHRPVSELVAVLRTRPGTVPRADLLLTRVGQVGMPRAIVEAASRLPDPRLRSLGAIHLATALRLREDLDALVTYDDRLASAAASHDLPAAVPGRPDQMAGREAR